MASPPGVLGGGLFNNSISGPVFTDQSGVFKYSTNTGEINTPTFSHIIDSGNVDTNGSGHQELKDSLNLLSFSQQNSATSYKTSTQGQYGITGGNTTGNTTGFNSNWYKQDFTGITPSFNPNLNVDPLETRTINVLGTDLESPRLGFGDLNGVIQVAGIMDQRLNLSIETSPNILTNIFDIMSNAQSSYLSETLFSGWGVVKQVLGGNNIFGTPTQWKLEKTFDDILGENASNPSDFSQLVGDLSGIGSLNWMNTITGHVISADFKLNKFGLITEYADDYGVPTRIVSDALNTLGIPTKYNLTVHDFPWETEFLKYDQTVFETSTYKSDLIDTILGSASGARTGTTPSAGDWEKLKSSGRNKFGTKKYPNPYRGIAFQVIGDINDPGDSSGPFPTDLKYESVISSINTMASLDLPVLTGLIGTPGLMSSFGHIFGKPAGEALGYPGVDMSYQEMVLNDAKLGFRSPLKSIDWGSITFDWDSLAFDVGFDFDIDFPKFSTRFSPGMFNIDFNGPLIEFPNIANFPDFPLDMWPDEIIKNAFTAIKGLSGDAYSWIKGLKPSNLFEGWDKKDWPKWTFDKDAAYARFLDILSGTGDFLGEAIGSITDGLGDIGSFIKNIVVDSGTWVYDKVANLRTPEWLKTGGKKANAFTDWAWEGVKNNAGSAYSTISEVLKDVHGFGIENIWEPSKSGLSSTGQIIADGFDYVADSPFGKGIGRAKDAFLRIGGAVGDAGIELFSNTLGSGEFWDMLLLQNPISSFVFTHEHSIWHMTKRFVSDKVVPTLENMATTLGKFGGIVGDALSGGFKGAKDYLSNLDASPVFELVNNMYHKTKDGLKSIGSAIADLFPSLPGFGKKMKKFKVWEDFKDLLGSMGGKLKTAFGKFGSWMKGMLGSTGDWLSGAMSSVASFGGKVGSAVMSGAKKVGTYIGDVASALAPAINLPNINMQLPGIDIKKIGSFLANVGIDVGDINLNPIKELLAPSLRAQNPFIYTMSKFGGEGITKGVNIRPTGANAPRHLVRFDEIKKVNPYELMQNTDLSEYIAKNLRHAIKGKFYPSQLSPTQPAEIGDVLTNIKPGSSYVASAESEQQGMPLYFKDLRDNTYLYFRAYIDSLTENISPTWTSHNYIGRSEPVYTYENAEREISFGMKLAAHTVNEFSAIYGKLRVLTSLAYPEYQQDILNQKSRMKPPLIMFRLGELYGNADETAQGAHAGFIKSLSYEVDGGTPWEYRKGQRVPKYISATIGIQVIHTSPPNKNTAFYGYLGGGEEQLISDEGGLNSLLPADVQGLAPDVFNSIEIPNGLA